ncbi:MAG: LuxR C-terminal-related transcriptional regulator [Anaerolineae bacterium]
MASGSGEADGDLLATKLFPPRLRPDSVARPRLWQRIEQGTAAPLTLVAAPAGSGKTTALAEWLAHTRLPVAWVSLDEGDDDPARFWRYVVAALRRVNPSLGAGVRASLGTATPLAPEAIATLLANDVVRQGERLVLALDDLHVVEAQAIHAALAYLIDHMPPQLHLLVATRSDPPWPLFRWRARGQLAEIRATDLRFSADEAAEMLNERIGLGLSPADVAALAERTEGWATGLQLAALTLRGRTDAAAVIRAFTGDDRYVLDYLLGEVLQRQPEPLQRFLLRTSVLERLCGPLCDAVTGEGEGQERLEALERANLFLVPLDGERRWYRYHRLFVDLLRSRLRSLPRPEVRALHRRASAWLQSHGYTTEAVGQALAGEDAETAARLIEAVGSETLLRGEINTVLGWLAQLPPGLVAARPHLALDRAWALVLSGALAEAEPALEAAEAVAAAMPPGLADDVLGEADALRGHSARQRGDVAAAAALSRRALQRLPAGARTMRGLAALNLGLARWMSGDLEGAETALSEAAMATQQGGDRGLAVVAVGVLGQVFEMRGHLRQAAETYERALTLGGAGESLPPFAGLALVGKAGVLWEWDRLDEAEAMALRGLELGRSGGHVETQAGAYSTLAAIAGARGAPDAALALLDQAEHDLAGRLPPLLCASMRIARAGVRLSQGDTWEAERALDRHPVTGEGALSPQDELALLLRARLLIARGRATPDGSEAREALPILERVGVAAQAAGRGRLAIEVLVLRSLALQAAGNLPEALATLDRALTLAEGEGFVRVFADEGGPMARLLQLVAGRGTHASYVTRLLGAMGIEVAEGEGSAGSHAAPLVESLSPREVEVLRLLAVGASNREIADRFVISIYTVKKHVSNVFGKLGVASRTQAVARARELGLL